MGDLRYADAGVDIDEGDRAVRLIKESVSATHGPEVLGGIGAFSGLFAFDPQRWKRPVLASSTDSVGTKVKVAIAAGRPRGIGIDLDEQHEWSRGGKATTPSPTASARDAT